MNWDGIVRIDTSSVFPTKSCTSVRDCEYLKEDPFVMGHVPPRAPCFPFKQNDDDTCLNQLYAFEDDNKRKIILVQTLLGTLKRNRDEEQEHADRETLTTAIVGKMLEYAAAVEQDLREVKNAQIDANETPIDWENHTMFSDLKNHFVHTDPIELTATEWLRQFQSQFNSCVNQASSDMNIYADHSGIFDSAEPGFSNFFFLLQQPTELPDEYTPNDIFPGFEFPVLGQDLLSAPLQHLQYTLDVLSGVRR